MQYPIEFDVILLNDTKEDRRLEELGIPTKEDSSHNRRLGKYVLDLSRVVGFGDCRTRFLGESVEVVVVDLSHPIMENHPSLLISYKDFLEIYNSFLRIRGHGNNFYVSRIISFKESLTLIRDEGNTEITA